MDVYNMPKQVIRQLLSATGQLTNEEYGLPCKTLFNASVGQHVRHVIELYVCLFAGYETGYVNYDERKRNARIETDRDFAIEHMHDIIREIERPDKDLILQANCHETTAGTLPINTNYFRELVYNLEHTVHHMALIRIGMHEVSNILLPEGFGVAASTIKYRKACAQ